AVRQPRRASMAIDSGDSYDWPRLLSGYGQRFTATDRFHPSQLCCNCNTSFLSAQNARFRPKMQYLPRVSPLRAETRMIINLRRKRGQRAAAQGCSGDAASAPAANGRQGIGVLQPKGLKMKKIVLSAIAAAVLSASSAFAADMPVKAKPPVPEPSPWDWAFGGALLSDYNFRGISPSNRGPSGTVYSETRYNVNSS